MPVGDCGRLGTAQCRAALDDPHIGQQMVSSTTHPLIRAKATAADCPATGASNRCSHRSHRIVHPVCPLDWITCTVMSPSRRHRIRTVPPGCHRRPTKERTPATGAVRCTPPHPVVTLASVAALAINTEDIGPTVPDDPHSFGTYPVQCRRKRASVRLSPEADAPSCSSRCCNSSTGRRTAPFRSPRPTTDPGKLTDTLDLLVPNQRPLPGAGGSRGTPSPAPTSTPPRRAPLAWCGPGLPVQVGERPRTGVQAVGAAGMERVLTQGGGDAVCGGRCGRPGRACCSPTR
jgi:hypothetical protein